MVKWRKLGRAAGVAIAGYLALGAASGTALAQKTVNWRMQSNLSAGEPGYEAAKAMFVDQLSVISGGRIKIQLHPTGALFPIGQSLEAIGGGITEIGMAAGGYFVGKMGPIAALEMGTPGAERTPIERYNFFYEKGFIDIVREAYAKYGIYYLGPNLAPQWDIISRKPIRSMKDFEGLKIRATGIELPWYQSMGAAPVNLSGAEIYTALATNVVDAVRWGSPSVHLALGMPEVGKFYIEPSPMPAANNNILINKRAWDGLPDDLKAMLDWACKMASLDYLARGAMADGAARAKMKNEMGVEFVRIPPEEWAAMEKKAQEIWSGYADKDPLSGKAVALLKGYLADLGR